MDIRSLQYFITVAEELNITKAAEKLHMSQPPLSAQIKGLEAELGTHRRILYRLCERTGGRVL